jgi:SAM-dependent methyltransferase
MKTKHRFRRGNPVWLPRAGTWACPYMVLCVLCILSTATAQPLARHILEATGFKGGLIVHIGCGDGKLTAALRASDSYLVHGLDVKAENVEKAREHIQSLGLYGSVSVERFDGQRLPYADNLVNLVVSENLGGVSMDEVMRVLAPGGIAYIKSGGKWIKQVKSRSAEIDEWTHFLYDASNNAVSKDSIVGPPRQLQWVAGPQWARSHDHLASVSVLVSSGGRIFYIVDEGPTVAVVLQPRWSERFVEAARGRRGSSLCHAGYQRAGQRARCGDGKDDPNVRTDQGRPGNHPPSGESVRCRG